MEMPALSTTESTQKIENESFWKHHLKLQKESDCHEQNIVEKIS